jgi:hypothetical protein
MIQDEEDFDSYNILINEVKLTVIGYETLEIDGEMVECLIAQIKMDLKYELIGNGDLEKMTTHLIITSKSWSTKEDHITCQDETTTTITDMSEFSEDYYRESYNVEIESIEKTTYTELPDSQPYPLKVGKTWSLKESYIINTTTKSRDRYNDDPYSEWEFEYEEKSGTITTNYEVLSENENVVPAGAFNTLKIKSQVVGESDYDVDYYDSNEMMIQSESYIDESLESIIKLKSYQYSNNESEEDNEFPIILIVLIIGLLVVVVLVILVVIVLLMKKKKSFSVNTDNEPVDETPKLQQFSNCPYCEKQLKFPTTPKYCPFCNNQLLK